MTAYYNENEPFAAEWLRNLIKEGLLPDGEVDDRSICDVRSLDLAGFDQCHFFAGIGGWPLALRLAGWPDDREVWTGSCPCQPFSQAGKGKGQDDHRHLWPDWYRLISKCRPAVIFGEQVPSAIAHGWWDTVCDDLEGEGYACGAIIAPAVSIGAPHIRSRLWFVAADAIGESLRDDQQWLSGRRADGIPDQGHAEPRHDGSAEPVAIASGAGHPFWSRAPGQWAHPSTAGSGWWDAEPVVRSVAARLPGRVGRLRGYGNAIVPQLAAEVIMAFLEARP